MLYNRIDREKKITSYKGPRNPCPKCGRRGKLAKLNTYICMKCIVWWNKNKEE